MKNLKSVGIALLVLAMAASLAAQNAPAPADSSVQIRTADPFFYAALEMKGNYNQMEAAFGQFFGEVGKQGLGMNMPFGVYYNSPATTPEADLKWDVGMALSDSAAVQAPLTVKKWGYTQTGNLIYEGPFSEIGSVYGKLFGWLGANGYDTIGPIMEKYFGPPAPDDKGQMCGKVEITVPVMKKPN
jgi:AraC family transcriptional regulator